MRSAINIYMHTQECPPYILLGICDGAIWRKAISICEGSIHDIDLGYAMRAYMQPTIPYTDSSNQGWFSSIALH